MAYVGKTDLEKFEAKILEKKKAGEKTIGLSELKLILAKLNLNGSYVHKGYIRALEAKGILKFNGYFWEIV